MLFVLFRGRDECEFKSVYCISMSTLFLQMSRSFFIDRFSITKTRKLTKHPIIRSDTGIHKSAPLRNLLHLTNTFGIHQRTPKLFIRGNHDAVHGGDAQGGPSIGDGIESIFDLEKFARAGEGC